MKKIAFILILLVLFIASVGCQVKSNYVFIHSESEISKIEIGKVELVRDADEYLVNVKSEKELYSEDIINLLVDFKKITCYKRVTDPGSIRSNETAIKITYSNGDFEIISKDSQASFIGESYKYSGFYYFERDEFIELLNKYLFASKQTNEKDAISVDSKEASLQESADSIAVSKSAESTDTKAADLAGNQYHPIVFSYKDENGYFSKAYVLGGSNNGKWYKIGDFTLKAKYICEEDFGNLTQTELETNFVDLNLIKNNDDLVFYGLNQCTGNVKMQKLTLEIPPANGEYIITAAFPKFKQEKSFLVGIKGTWNAIPRMVTISENKEIFSFDIEGDKKNEQIVLKNIAFDTENKEPGKNIYFTKDSTETLLSFVSDEALSAIQNALNILVIDFNGDGKLEILLQQMHTYGDEITVYEVENNVPKVVLQYYNQ